MIVAANKEVDSSIREFKMERLCYTNNNLFRMRSKRPISELLLLWDHTNLVRCNCAKGAAFNANYSRQLPMAIGKVNGLVTSDLVKRKL
jgi:hypothetical protein